MPKIKTGEIQKDVSQIQQSDSPKKRNMPLDPQTLDTLLQTGVQATATIAGQRAASGRSAARQERIAACGRRPLFGRRKKEAYRKCLEENNIGGTKSMPSDNYTPTQIQDEDGGGGNMKFVYIGLGVLLLAGIGFFVIKKMGK